ncbi:MAG: CHC2 zinc finger domain-containing protein, partial [Nitrospiraceae bacterium]|nr:CHC2 zinc finger domain-containing protein [Nitrospiraceae bacterium]
MRTSGLLEEIKSRVDIVDFISSYVHLKKAGLNWKGVCPFHSEKTPSFMVSPSKQIFHCFGCSAGGDVIAFASKYENITFNEALTLLAKRAGIPLDRGKPASRTYEKQERIRDALRNAAEFYAGKLRESDTALEYVRRRGVSDASLEQFRIG